MNMGKIKNIKFNITPYTDLEITDKYIIREFKK